jgi:hypothetical protein
MVLSRIRAASEYSFSCTLSSYSDVKSRFNANADLGRRTDVKEFARCRERTCGNGLVLGQMWLSVKRTLCCSLITSLVQRENDRAV